MKRQRQSTRLAIRILKESARGPTPKTDATRLALYVLLPYVGTDRAKTYWQCAGHPHSPHRGFSLMAQIRLFEAMCDNQLGRLDTNV